MRTWPSRKSEASEVKDSSPRGGSTRRGMGASTEEEESSPIPVPRSAIRDPGSAIRDPRSEIRDPRGPVHRTQYLQDNLSAGDNRRPISRDLDAGFLVNGICISSPFPRAHF